MFIFIYSLKSYFILYNDNMDINRIRFTIAHEIGHIALGHEESNDETESEADYFARHLLVPIYFRSNYNRACLFSSILFTSVDFEYANKGRLKKCVLPQLIKKIIFTLEELLIMNFHTVIK